MAEIVKAAVVPHWLVWISVLLVTGLGGCSRLTTIQAVLAHPNQHWFTATVYVKGKVSDRVPLIDGLVYQLQDRTGKIWVLTQRTTQPVGQQILIKGKVHYQSIPIAGQELGEAYIEEQQVLEPRKYEH